VADLTFARATRRQADATVKSTTRVRRWRKV
jgi:hypothetical protein